MRMGTSSHLSPLMQKAKRLGVRNPSDLEEIAIARGLRYFGRPAELSPDAKKAMMQAHDHEFFSQEELTIALMSPTLPYSLNRLRMAGAMLGAEGISAEKILKLARMERCETTVRHIAELGSKVEPSQTLWHSLLEQLPPALNTPPDVLPHLSRFVTMSGLDRTGRSYRTQWIRPTP